MAYNIIASGEIAGSATAAQLPDIDVAPGYVIIKAVDSNVGNVYLGGSGVTKVNASTDTTTGIELDAGEEVKLESIANLNLLFLICDNAGDDLTYLAVRG